MDTLGTIFLALGLGFMAVVIGIEVRFMIRRLQSGGWPTATATIRAEFVGSVGRGARAAFFAYDFIFQGAKHCGQFALVPLASEDQGRKLLSVLGGLPISIRYNPKRPEISFLVNHLYDARFDGVSATQNPYWFLIRSEIPEETISLFPK